MGVGVGSGVGGGVSRRGRRAHGESRSGQGIGVFCDSATARAFNEERGDLPMNMHASQFSPLYPPPYPATLNVYFPSP